jgi:hypothetical protein
LTGAADRAARWSIGPARGEPHAQLSLIGTQGSVQLHFSADGQTCSIGDTSGLVLPVEAPGRAAERFVAHVLDETAQVDAAQADAAQAGSALAGSARRIDWPEVCRALEILDAAQRSVQRRRTIELYHERVTEQETFKSVMAVGGCAMLLWVLVLLLLAGIVEGLRLPLRETFVWLLWPVLLFAPLAFFLALQMLQLVFVKRK